MGGGREQTLYCKHLSGNTENETSLNRTVGHRRVDRNVPTLSAVAVLGFLLVFLAQ